MWRATTCLTVLGMFDVYGVLGETCVTESVNPSLFEIPEEVPLLPGLPPSKPSQFFITNIAARAEPVNAHETPIITRLQSLIDTAQWNCIAAFHPSYLDAWTAARPTVAVPIEEVHTSDARALCSVAAIGGMHAVLLPGKDTFFNEWYAAAALNATAGFDQDLVTTCPDPLNGTCLVEWVSCQGWVPFAVGNAVAYELAALSREDGWNSEGDLTSTGAECTGNCRRYQDTTGYMPEHASDCAMVPRSSGRRSRRLAFGVYEGESVDSACWEPLLEDNNIGYFTRQEHVTPHIGTQARPRALTKEDVQARRSEAPEYDYDAEGDLVVERLAGLDDFKKVQIEFFDLKSNLLDVLAVLTGEAAGPAMTYERQVWLAAGATAAEHDSVLVAWNDKVKHSRIRTTTVLEAGPSTLVDTYAGPFQGTRSINRNQVEPYIRVMPHVFTSVRDSYLFSVCATPRPSILPVAVASVPPSWSSTTLRCRFSLASIHSLSPPPFLLAAPSSNPASRPRRMSPCSTMTLAQLAMPAASRDSTAACTSLKPSKPPTIFVAALASPSWSTSNRSSAMFPSPDRLCLKQPAVRIHASFSGAPFEPSSASVHRRLILHISDFRTSVERPTSSLNWYEGWLSALSQSRCLGDIPGTSTSASSCALLLVHFLLNSTNSRGLCGYCAIRVMARYSRCSWQRSVSSWLQSDPCRPTTW